jgi:hypothetical protein
MRWMRSRKSVAVFGVAVVVFAALLSVVVPDLHDLVLTPLWLVAPAVSIIGVRRTATRCQDQPLALLSLARFRAPPATLAIA